jgi:glycosyltransferase involved in cell wall biosynthesis
MSLDVAVIILTKNEEKNLPFALRSVAGWARQVFVFDSFSTDGTEAVARSFGASFAQHRFEDYSKQRNAALTELPIEAAWTLFLDADEQLDPAIRNEIEAVIANGRDDGYEIALRFIWRGKWVRRGYYRHAFKTVLFRTGKARCDDRGINEHILVDGPVGRLSNPIHHEDQRGVEDWIRKHVEYAKREAARTARGESPPLRELTGTVAERKNWIRWHVWQRLPVPLRATAWFGKRMVLDLAFLDGREAIEYHFLQALWFPMLVGAFEAERAVDDGEGHGVPRTNP